MNDDRLKVVPGLEPSTGDQNPTEEQVPTLAEIEATEVSMKTPEEILDGLAKRVMPSFGGQPLTIRDVTFMALGLQAGMRLLDRLRWRMKIPYLGKVFHAFASVPPDLGQEVLRQVVTAAIRTCDIRDSEGKLIESLPPAELATDATALSMLIYARCDQAMNKAPKPEQLVEPAKMSDLANLKPPTKGRRP